MMNDMGWFGGGWFFMLLFWGLVILGLVVLVRWLAQSAAAKNGKTALEILKERYARGEIGREEFEQKRNDLDK